MAFNFNKSTQCQTDGADACTNARAVRQGVAQTPGEGVRGMPQLTSTLTYIFPFDHHGVFCLDEWVAGNLYGFPEHAANTRHTFDCKRGKQRHCFDLFVGDKNTENTFNLNAINIGAVCNNANRMIPQKHPHCCSDKVLIIPRVLSCPKFYSKHRHGDKVLERGMGWDGMGWGGCQKAESQRIAMMRWSWIASGKTRHENEALLTFLAFRRTFPTSQGSGKMPAWACGGT